MTQLKNPKDTIFSKNLRNLLETKDKTQKDLADYVGVSTASVNFWVKGTNIPKIDKIKKIASFFHVPVQALLSEENEKLDKPPNLSEVSVVPADAKSESGLMDEIFADRPDVLKIIDGKFFGDKENKKPLSPEAKLHIKNSVLFTLRACGYNV